MAVSYCRACGKPSPPDDHPCLLEFQAAMAVEGTTVEQALEVAKRGHADREIARFFAKQRLKLERNIAGLHADKGTPLPHSQAVKAEAKARSEKMLADLDAVQKRLRGEIKSPAQEMAEELEAAK